MSREIDVHNLDDYDIETLVSVLREADDLYHNGHESFLTDSEYDTVRRYVEIAEPFHEYFTGVGAEVRGGKIKLPYTLGSLDQVYEGDIHSWMDKHNLHGENLTITDKLDGISALLVYDTSGLRIAYSRGNGKEGADITRHLKQIQEKSEVIPSATEHKIAVRGELILPVNSFHELKTIVKSRSGTPYKNPRNMISGLMNAEKNDPSVYKHIHFIAYDILNLTEEMNKCYQLDYLSENEFLVPVWNIVHNPGSIIDDEYLSEYLRIRKEKTEYEIDGIVIDVDYKYNRKKLSSNSLNPKYAVKYKVADELNLAETEVSRVEWKISGHGYLKPTVWIKPVELAGVTVSKATGFNAKFINENKVGPGTRIKITRSGDVIPFIKEVIKSTTPQMPEGEWEWNETGVDAVYSGSDETSDLLLTTRQLIDFFSIIDAPMLREGNIVMLQEYFVFQSTYEAIEEIFKLPKQSLENILGANGKKVYDGLEKIKKGIPAYQFLGALPFFGRGIGPKVLRNLFKGLSVESLGDLYAIDQTDIQKVEGFKSKTAEKIIRGIGEALRLCEAIDINLLFENFDQEGEFNDCKFVFTGFRDKDLERKVEELGGKVQSSVSSKTTMVVASDPESNSGKVKKANDLKVTVIGEDVFKDWVDHAYEKQLNQI